MDMQGESKAERQERERREAESQKPDKNPQRKRPSSQSKEEIPDDWNKVGRHINFVYFRQSLAIVISRCLLAASLVYGGYQLVTDIFPTIEAEVIARYVKGNSP